MQSICRLHSSAPSQQTFRVHLKLGSLFKGFSKSIDESLLKGHKDVDQWFETEKKFLDDYHVKCVLIPPPPMYDFCSCDSIKL